MFPILTWYFWGNSHQVEVPWRSISEHMSHMNGDSRRRGMDHLNWSEQSNPIQSNPKHHYISQAHFHNWGFGQVFDFRLDWIGLDWIGLFGSVQMIHASFSRSPVHMGHVFGYGSSRTLASAPHHWWDSLTVSVPKSISLESETSYSSWIAFLLKILPMKSTLNQQFIANLSVFCCSISIQNLEGP